MIDMKNKMINFLVYFLVIVLFVVCIFNKSYFNYLNDLLWLILAIVLCIFSIYLTVRFKFVQFRFIKIIKTLFSKKDDFSGAISGIEALMITMAGKIGVGSLSGVALAIYLGGPGVIFWLWISSLIFSILTYCEACLGIKYHKKIDSVYQGGPSYYIKNGLNNSGLAIIYSIMIILAYIVGFLGIQSNTIVKSVCQLSVVSPIMITILLCVVVMFIIFGKTKRMISIISKFVPIMTFIYILMGMYIVFKNISNFPNIFMLIINNAFSFKSGFVSVITIGVQKGLFASESGIGTSAIAAGSTNDSPNRQGLLQVFGVHFTTLIICTISALIVLNSNYNIVSDNINGIEIMILAFYYNFGKFGSYLLCLIIILFAFSTIIGGYFFGESCFKYINNGVSKFGLILFKLFCLFLVFIGGIINSGIIWSVIDVFVLLLTIINGYSIYKLYKSIDKVLE